MSVATLWLPVLAAAVAVFIASSIIHMVIRWHLGDYKPLANEDAVRAALNAGNAGPGQYFVPWCPDHKQMNAPEMQKKFTEGPIAMLTLRKPGPPSMGPALGGWFAYNLAISAIAACVAAEGLTRGAAAGTVMCVAGTAAFLAYGGGPVQLWIWMGKPTRAMLTEVADAVIYGLITGGALAWLWPK